MQTNPSILIAAKPGVMRDGVQAVLTAIPRAKVMDPADDGASALRAVADHQPALILLDTNLPNHQVWTLLEKVKTQWPQVQCLVLADNRQQRQTAQAAGADHVLIKGCPAKEFYANINGMLSRYSESGQGVEMVKGTGQ
ncbi:MAG: response regulator transcription factor [Chloroflexi bacterium]|nr:response regulator transcription factor [Chloroflexota bacterium]